MIEEKSGSTETPAPPVVSVIVPSYNKPEYLPDCLKSIQSQTFTDWKCVVVSDGSPHVEQVQRAVEAMDDKRFRLVELKENRGPAVARNCGASVAEGEWLIFVDEDDLIAPDCLRRLLDYAIQAKADIVHPQVLQFDGTRRRRHYVAVAPHETLHSQPMLGVGFLIKRQLWDELGGYDESPLVNGREDTEWWIRAFHSRAKVVVTQEALYIYRPPRKGCGDSSHNLNSMQRERAIRRYIVQKHAELYRGRLWLKLRMLAKGYWWEGRWKAEHGETWKGACLMTISVMMAPTAHSAWSLIGYWRERLARRRDQRRSEADAQ